MGESTPKDNSQNDGVLWLLEEEGGSLQSKNGGVGGLLAEKLRTTPQTVSAMLRRLEEAGKVRVIKNKRRGIVEVILVAEADEATEDDSASEEQPSSDTPIEEESAGGEADSSTDKPQEEGADDRVYALLGEAAVIIAEAMSARENGLSCVEDVAAAQGSLTGVLQALVSEASNDGREQLLGELRHISLAEAVDVIGRDPQ